jgi:farnesyl diphosphate synthase
MDDVMDGSETRRGRPCWYRKNNLGVAAINDGILLESGIYQLLRKHFRDKPYYVDIMELFHDVIFMLSLCSHL